MKNRILVVEDEEKLRRVIQLQLQSAGFEVDQSGSAEEGLRRADRADIILTDLRLPGMDGLEVLRKLRANLTTRHTPVILLTAMRNVDQRVQGLQSGADDYVLKPFAPQELNARVEATLRRSRRDLIADSLTKLPGNLVLRNELGQRLERQESFSVCYADLNHFKAFVDHYGFEKASEVIQRLARLIYKCWVEHGAREDFIGHIGGDDFLILCGQERAEPLTVALVEGFHDRVPGFYGEEDWIRGYIEGVDRYGAQRRFPLLSLSVAIIDVGSGDFSDKQELAAFAASCKEKVKQRGKEKPLSWKRYRRMVSNNRL